VDESKVGDFSGVLSPAPATLVDTLLIDVIGSSKVSLGASEHWQHVKFSQTEIASGMRKTIYSSTPTTGVASSLLSQAKITGHVVGLPIPLDPLLKAVGGALSPVAPALDTLLMAVTGTLGVGLGEADLTVTGMRCGQAVLVA
jgi:uncharacterized membrane protein